MDGVARFDVAALRIDDELDVIVVDRGKKDELFADFTRRLWLISPKRRIVRVSRNFLLKLGLGFFLLFSFSSFSGESSRNKN